MNIVEVALEIALPTELLNRIAAKYGARAAREVSMATSVGGIGPLLRDRLAAQAARGHDVIGISLLYETAWVQAWHSWGQMHLQKRTVGPYLREFLKDTGQLLHLTFFDESILPLKAWQASYGRATVYFLDAPEITEVVYPNEEDAPPKTPDPKAWAEDMKHRQNWLVGRGALALLKALNKKSDLVVLSETPAALAHHRLIEDLFTADPFFEGTRYVFNDHTPLEYVHPHWGPDLLKKLHVAAAALETQPNKTNVDVTRLIIALCDGAYGVSRKHGRIMRAMPSLKDYAEKMGAVTNGVQVQDWQTPVLRNASQMSDESLLEAKRKLLEELADWMWRRYGLWHTWRAAVAGKPIVLWTRRITGYKRLDILWKMLKSPAFRKRFLATEVVLLVGGRVHQHDDQAQTFVYNLCDLLAQDRELQDRVVVIDNFNVFEAPRLFWGAHAAVMLSDDGREASATGFMKAQVNGGLIIATEDGAIPESVTFLGKEKEGKAANGFEVTYSHGEPTPESFLTALEQFAGIYRQPAPLAAMMRAALAACAPVSIERTVEETLSFYQRLAPTVKVP